ncbi:hypothetical protein NXC14_CH01220 [Rhizobium sp. NXC14]|nr:hypothetical protein NXC14_CH01220 [Rhizobium sp. NXC14]
MRDIRPMLKENPIRSVICIKISRRKLTFRGVVERAATDFLALAGVEWFEDP